MAENSMNVTPPSNVDAESSVIGSILLDNSSLLEVSEILQPQMFFREANRKIFVAFQELYATGTPIDTVTLTDLLRRKNQIDEVGGVVYLVGVSDSVPTSVHSKFYAKIVARTHNQRKALSLGQNIMQLAQDTDIEYQELWDTIINLTIKQAPKDENTKHQLGSHLKQAFEEIEQIRRGEIPESYCQTGFSDLDRGIVLPMQPGTVTVVAGITSSGKTSLTLQMALALAKQGKRVAYISCETTPKIIDLRALAIEARVSQSAMKSGSYSGADLKALSDSGKRLQELPFSVYDANGITVEQLYTKLALHKQQFGLEIAFIDYVQLLESARKTDNRQGEIGYISRQLKALAKRLNIVVVELAQFSRDIMKRANPRPTLADLKESGQLEQDADLCLLIYREWLHREVLGKECDPGKAEIIIAKQKEGATGSHQLHWIPELSCFRDGAYNTF
jgi:replicative DNA helicase